MSSVERSRGGWSERLEPVLVKDVRAALRGKAFALTLLGAVSLTTAVLLFVLVLRTVDGAEPEGERLFAWVAWSASAAMGVFVPLWAFTSLGEELDGDAYDLLAISRLSAWRVVWGKFLAAMLQCGLVFCAAFPFALFAFLLGGTDAGTVALRMLGVLGSSAICVAAALAVSALARTRWVRAMLLAVVAFCLLWLHGIATFVAARTAHAAAVTGAPEPLVQLAGQLVLSAAFVGFFLALASARLAHPGSSRSTPVRAWLLALTIAQYVSPPFAMGPSAFATMLGYAALFYFPIAIVVLLVLCTELEPLPRAHAWRPRSKLAALVASPFVAGGGRGALFALLLVVVMAVGGAVRLAVMPGVNAGVSRTSLLLCVALPSLYVLVPAGLLARWNTDARRTRTIRAVIAMGWGLLWVGTALVLAASGDDPDPMRVLFGSIVPVRDLFAADGTVQQPEQVLVLVALALAGVLVNLPRIVRGVREVLARVEPRASVVPARTARALDAPPQP